MTNVRVTSARAVVVTGLLVVAITAGCSVFRPLLRPFITPFSIDGTDANFALPETPVVVFYVDGLRKDVLEEMAQAGELPHLKRYLLDRAASVDNAVSSVPSLTYPNASAMVTGVYPSHHGVFANKWFDRDRLVYRNYESADSMWKANVDLDAPTIYELLSDKLTAVVGMQVNKGAKMRHVTSTGDGGLPAGVAWTLGYQEEVDAIMAENMSDLGREAKCLGHWPDFTLVYFPGPDDVAHFKGWASNDYRKALRSLDCSLGQILRAFDRGGVLDKMTLVLTADHGMHDVGRCEYREVVELLREQSGIEAYGSAHDLDEVVPWLDNENDASLPSRMGRFGRWNAVVTTAGERQASIHLRCGWSWSGRPAFDQILWYHRQGEAAESRGLEASLPALLAADPAIDLAAVRDGVHAVQLFGKAGVARIERKTGGGKAGLYRYTVVSGADPLFGSDPAPPAIIDGAFHGSREWLEATVLSSRPDAVAQLGDLFDTRKAGEIVLFAARGWDFSKKYVGGHGGLDRDDMIIPMYFAGPRFEPGRRIAAGRLVDLVPTVLDLMGLASRSAESCRMDGESLLPALASPLPESRGVARAR